MFITAFIEKETGGNSTEITSDKLSDFIERKKSNLYFSSSRYSNLFHPNLLQFFFNLLAGLFLLNS
jgi:hypothetical protein